ncbi:solute carrier organic anion transporter family member 74D-like isoform X2 [Drosophila busckii]|uniref:solute carrier organic anion transporter family member 74D-like isoform X2 n=1 Tax=Drosophila busckii TaxID=30019 RepID=UPI00083F0F37|nr:solute carrier organic anion transporter family member 74D-like isoform X2 [Drosophila busckii]
MSADKKIAPEQSPFLEDKQQLNLEYQQKCTKENKDVSCGFWIFKGAFMQTLATEKMFVIIHGLGGLVVSMGLAYFNGTISTLEKRYKISSELSGIIIGGNDIGSVLTSAIAGYCLSKAHRPRWMAFGYFTYAIFCLLTCSLHFIYGAGADALQLTQEFGGFKNESDFLKSSQGDQKLCLSHAANCKKEEGLWVPPLILYVAQLIAGIGLSMFWVVGVAYMDDNTSKSKSPILLSVSGFLRTLGPALGYCLASVCLRYFIEPYLHPIITPKDSRWLGAWWLGWLILAVLALLFALLMYMFPKELPSTRERRLKEIASGKHEHIEQKELSFGDMCASIKRLMSNKIYMYNTSASLFYFFGYLAYWIYTAKYIEIQYRQSAAVASMATGSIALAFSALGVILSGIIVSKLKPKARSLAAWNGMVDFVTLAGVVIYIFIGCSDSDKLTSLSSSTSSCSASCHCEYVHYAPICAPGNVTYISACHAGCTGKSKDPTGLNMYTGCDCMPLPNFTNSSNQYAYDGACPVDCQNQFYMFLAVMCMLKLIGSSGRTSNMLISLRCVSPADKTFSLGLNAVLNCLLAFLPSPIVFGKLMDKYCIVWGKTCSTKGNCWLYDTAALRYTFNFAVACFLFVACCLNMGVWYNAKNLKIFDEKPPKNNENEDDLNLAAIGDIVKTPLQLEDP